MNFDREQKLRRLAGVLMKDDMPIVVGDGWFHLIYQAVADLNRLAVRSKLPIRITWIAVSDGGLAIETNIDEIHGDDAIKQAVTELATAADTQARLRCQTCGGVWRSSKITGVWHTRCEACSAMLP